MNIRFIPKITNQGIAAIIVFGLVLTPCLANAQPAGNLNHALIGAAARWDLQTVKNLLNRGADVNRKDSNGGTPLMYAALEGQVLMAELLLDKGANADSRDPDAETALMKASLRGHVEVTTFS